MSYALQVQTGWTGKRVWRSECEAENWPGIPAADITPSTLDEVTMSPGPFPRMLLKRVTWVSLERSP